ncbi:MULTISPECIES: hypothetical protein [unclassified Sphingomonas]|uniref:hypothetical protein n=1 Tax=unclassified Sphingomonas TaxID=196159 RepID=UPI00092C6BD2|nr:MULTISPECIES: hypothetical protein [unclassified Sphingomonas]MBN8847375.1 hypothetical protein [Sphingomonas sp.]OJV28216.1 MAG: hypothetical protein BGO24_07745 [Sphingomonas sp. 67-36]
MADRASASIRIGGVLARVLVDALIATIAREGGFAGWDETPIDAATLERKGSLEVCGYELAGGVFDELEAFCVEHGLAFIRTSGSCPGAFGPERVVYKGAGEPGHFALDEDDRVVIDRSTMEALGTLEAARCYFDAADFEPPELTVARRARRSG